MVERQHPDEPDVDAIFESIVARWDESPDRPRRQTTGDVRLPRPPKEKAADASSSPEVGTPVPWRTDPTNSVADALLNHDEHPGAADDDEGFTPPPPDPLPPLTDRLFWGALAGLILGPLGLIWIAISRPAGFWPKAIVMGLILGGFVCLVLRQPSSRGDDPDQGARV